MVQDTEEVSPAAGGELLSEKQDTGGWCGQHRGGSASLVHQQLGAEGQRAKGELNLKEKRSLTHKPE